MREIRGRTLKEVIDEVHDAIEDRQWKQTSSGWSFRRLVDAFHEVCVASMRTIKGYCIEI